MLDYLPFDRPTGGLQNEWCGAPGHCRISPPSFLAECRKRRLNQGSFVSAVCLVVCFLWFVLCLCVYFCDLYWVFLILIVCLSITVKCLAVKTATEMTYTVSGGALNSTQSNPILQYEYSLGDIYFDHCSEFPDTDFWLLVWLGNQITLVKGKVIP